MPTCSGCGGNFDDTFQFCPYCGKAKPITQEPVKTDASIGESHSPMDCPKCHRVDSVSKVSAIVQGGIHQIKGQFNTGASYESYHGTQWSDLALRLAPPTKPRPATPFADLTWWIIGVTIVSAPGIFCILTAIAPAIANEQKMTLVERLITLVVGLFIVIIPVTFFVLWLSKKNSRDAKDLEAMAQWEYSIRRWDQLYYCSRDDCLFIPTENYATSISNMKEILNWHPF